MTRTRCRMDRQAARIVNTCPLPTPTTLTVVLGAHEVR